jgi:parvulin-like peptidyl-prolyl isomerase
MKLSYTLSTLPLFLAATSWADNKSTSLEEVAAHRWSEMNADRIAGTADGQGITLSDVRRQIEPVVSQIRASAKTDTEFNQALEKAAHETLKSIADRQLVIAEFKSGTGKLPSMYIDQEIEETIRRDFGGDRNRFVAALREQGTTPLAYRKTIEDKIVFDYMIGQVRKAATEVSPGRIQEYYEKNKSRFLRKEQFQIHQITITQGAAESAEEGETRAQAWATAVSHPEKIAETIAKYNLVNSNLKGKELGFADVAKLVSSDDYAAKGGEIGWFDIEQLNEKIGKTLNELKDGEASSAIKFDIPGARKIWLIIRRDGHREKGYANLNEPEVFTECENRVRTENTTAVVDKWLNELRQKHLVETR